MDLEVLVKTSGDPRGAIFLFSCVTPLSDFWLPVESLFGVWAEHVLIFMFRTVDSPTLKKLRTEFSAAKEEPIGDEDTVYMKEGLEKFMEKMKLESPDDYNVRFFFLFPKF